jgi:hypothetical protein
VTGPEIDTNILRLVEALNALPGVYTFSSCWAASDWEPAAGQCGAGEFQVNFELARNHHGWRALRFIQWAIQQTDSCYDDGLGLKVWTDPEAATLCFEIHGHQADPDELAGILEKSCRGSKRRATWA